MRKPPDKQGQAQMSSLSEREVDTSNATLNTLFGGSHQKSWMTGGMAPVRPTPRRTPSSAPQPAASSLPPRPPILGQSSNSARKTMAPVLPSPTPSDEPSPDFVQPRIGTERSENHLHRPAIEASSRNQNVHTSPIRRHQERLQPQIRSDIPSYGGPVEPTFVQRGNAVDFTPANGTMAQEEATRLSPTGRRMSEAEQGSAAQLLQSPSPDIVSPILEEIELMRGVSTGSAVLPPGQPVLSYAPSQWPARVEELPSPVQRSTLPPLGVSNQPLPSPNFGVFDGRAQFERPSGRPPAPTPTTAHVHKRQRTQPPMMPSLQPRVVLIDAHIASIGGEMSLNALERPRFCLLKDACMKEDGFYVATHQIFCAWDVDWNQVVAIQGFPPQETLRVAFKILGQLIRDNSQLAPQHTLWFSQFPSPLSDLLRTSEPYRRTVQSVGRFLTRLAVDWVQFASDTRSRNYPPLVDELVNRLGILSPIFQGIVFTATRRNLGVVDDAVGDKMEKMFLKDRQDHQALSARFNTDRPPTEREIRERNGNLAVEYSILLGQVQRRRPSSGVNAGSVARVPTPSNVYQHAVSSPGINPSIQRLQQPSPFLSSSGSVPSSPDVMGNGQSVIGPPWRTSAGSPNIGTVNEHGRHTSLNSPQLLSSHSNSPSPHMMQNQFYNPQQIQTPVLRSNSGDHPIENNIQQRGPQGSGPPIPANHDYRQQQYAMQNPPSRPLQMAPQVSNTPVSLPQQRPQMQQQLALNQQQITLQLQDIAQELNFIGQSRQHRGGHSGQGPPQLEQRTLDREQVLLQQQAHLRQAMSQLQQTGQLPDPSFHNPQYQHPQNPRNSYAQTPQNPQYPQVGPPYQFGPDSSQHPHSGRPVIQSPLQPPRSNSMSSAPQPRRPGPVQVNNQGMEFIPHGRINNAPIRAPPQRLPSNGAQIILQQTEAYRQTPILDQTIIPPYHFPHPQGPPAPHMTALHQAHLRSPHLIPSKLNFPKTTPLDHPDRRFYQVVSDFAIPPSKLQATHAVATFEFSVSDIDFSKIVRSMPPTSKGAETRGFVPGSLQYRLRCVERKKSGDECTTSEWVLQDTSWPENAVFQLGSGSLKQQIELRRKKLHGKDLPVDLTTFVLMFAPKTRIQVTMSMPGRRQPLKEKNYFVAVEVIEIMGHRQIMQDAQVRRKPPQVTMESIKKSLTGPDLGDDEIALVSSELTLDITDPFSTRMFETPVRGDDCLHRECFDLETYLLSRPSKPNRKGQPSMTDNWKCPLCKTDARPQKLYVDEYLVEIRKLLEAQGKLDTKAIIVDMYGGWKPKDLPTTKRKGFSNDSDSDDDDDDMPVNGLGRQMKSTSAVIDISD